MNTQDYRLAPYGEGPQASVWLDKPHRLISDLCNEVEKFQNIDHTIGNPLFAIETNLDPLRKRIREGRINEALEIVDAIESSVNKAKNALIDVTKPLDSANRRL